MEKIDKYRILKRLGEGGFGAVYLAHDDRVDRDVAIKLFRPRDGNLIAFATSSSEDGLQVLRQRFVREARIPGRLADSPYIVNVYEFGETEEGSPYYVMPYVESHLGQYWAGTCSTGRRWMSWTSQPTPGHCPWSNA